ncbi:DsbA family protein [Haliangium sp.]|uniref:DsbA family protein n=1 Tax=Haliangium sp. TaxID=2663208 RepID=UPI003D0E7453
MSGDQAQLAKVGVSGTPAFFINGRFLSGAQPFPAFKQVIDEELKKADDRLAKGDSLAGYYDKYVVEQGLKALER